MTMPIPRLASGSSHSQSGKQDQQPRHHDGRRNAGIGGHVQELRAQVDVIAAAAQEQQRGGAVHHDARSGDQDHRALHHRHR